MITIVAVRQVQRALVCISSVFEGLVVSWEGDEIANEMFIVGTQLENHYTQYPKIPGLWIWEGNIEPPFLPSSIEVDDLDEETPKWEGYWRRPTEEEAILYTIYGENLWKKAKTN